MSSILDKAFNSGCDARLKGFPKGSNPFDSVLDLQRYNYWRLGWTDINNFWGSRVDGRWKFAQLPRIMGMG